MRSARRLDAALEGLVAAQGESRIEALIRLVDAVRPRKLDDTVAADEKINALTQRLSESEAARDALRDTVVWLLASKKTVHLFTDSGVLANEGFRSAMSRRLGERMLPPIPNRDRLKDLLSLIFRKRTDHRWIRAASDTAWLRLMHELRFGALRGTADGERISVQVLEALEVLSFRIASIGLEPEIVRIYPEIERYESPFLTQNAETHQLLARMHGARQGEDISDNDIELDVKHLLVLFDQCQEVVARIRKKAPSTGASVALTYLLVRLQQHLERARILLTLFAPKPEVDRNADRLTFLRTLLVAEARRHSISDLISTTADLLAQRVTSNVGQAGESYMTATRSEYFGLLASAMGAGLLVGLAVVVKSQLIDTPHAPFVQALLYSGNYIWCFVLMSVLHFSLATKQPAMTANRLAHGMEADGDGDPLDGLVELIVRTLRSQFIALVGNFIVAIPIPILIAWLLVHQGDAPLLSPHATEHLLAEASVTNPLTWLWGAITGVWLFLSGLIAGYYDNKAVYDHIPQRIARLRWIRIWGEKRAQRMANWLEHNLGAIVGSITFGVMLGATGAVGRVLGLPIDTLHVTFSAANSALAVFTSGGHLQPHQWTLVVTGVIAIGTMNLAVSFGLALWVALRSHRIRVRQSTSLLKKLLVRFFRTPLAFVWPPRNVTVEATTDAKQ